jgi:hypothetical protein
MDKVSSPATPMSLLPDIMAWEAGELDDEQADNLFEQLVETGLIYQLQGAYGREAARRGLI